MVARPSLYDDKVQRAVAEKLAPKVMAWDPDGEYDLEELTTDLQKALEDAFDYDAYKITRALDDNGWSVDAGLVDVFGSALSLALNERDQLVAQWIKDEGIVPAFKLGDHVSTRRRTNASQGEIVRIDAKQGRYVIFNPHAGHVRTGSGTHGVYENFEDVEEVCDAGGDQCGSG